MALYDPSGLATHVPGTHRGPETVVAGSTQRWCMWGIRCRPSRQGLPALDREAYAARTGGCHGVPLGVWLESQGPASPGRRRSVEL